ncbi:MAG: hypothetical protein Q7S38_00640 [bacterium]|nr:hypothetical protein [bacterium]
MTINKKLLFLAILLVMIPLTVYVAQKQQEVRQRASEGQTSLFFTEAGSTAPITQLALPPNQQKTLSVYLDTTGNAVSGFDFIIAFEDSSRNLTLGNLTEGADASKFPTRVSPDNPVNTGSNTMRLGKVTREQTVISGVLHLANITFTAGTSGTGTIAITYAEAVPAGGGTALSVSKSSLAYAITSTASTSVSSTLTPTPKPQSNSLYPTPASSTPTAALTLTPAPSGTPIPTSAPAVSQLPPAVLDINRDGCIGIGDFYAWRNAYQKHACSNTYPDVNNDKTVNLLDYNEWFIYRGAMCTAAPIARCPYLQK